MTMETLHARYLVASSLTSGDRSTFERASSEYTLAIADCFPKKVPEIPDSEHTQGRTSAHV